jgi:uncharacterized membrane protein YgdD (TMEM256/DUF423 family)
MNKNKLVLIIGGISGFTAVALGAFGAHGLKNIISAQMLDIYKTGVLYQLIHSLAILAIGLSVKEKFFKAAIFFLIGIILFSCSLYGYSLTQIKSLTLITPFGGISFLIGWVFVIIESIKMKG